LNNSTHGRFQFNKRSQLFIRMHNKRFPSLRCAQPSADFNGHLRYPWAMAPTINTTKPVATAIATFASTDKFIIFPSIMAATAIDLRF
jgi:hypothetical protein